MLILGALFVCASVVSILEASSSRVDAEKAVLNGSADLRDWSVQAKSQRLIVSFVLKKSE